MHVQVAEAIEKVFAERLHDFYGMLAYHYSRGENLEKAEVYLIKAGEESLKYSASSEALNYYRAALDLYLKQCGDASDPAKIAGLEKQIALALFNSGRYEEAVNYFGKALDHYWGKMPASKIRMGLSVLSSFFHIIIALYLPWMKFKNTPTQKEIEAIDLFHKKGKALSVIDSRRFFIESMVLCGSITKFDLSRFDLWLELFMSASALFSFTGISFTLSRKILDTCRDKVRPGNLKLTVSYDLLETTHNYFEGNWEAIADFDDNLVEKSLEIGEIWDASAHLYWHGTPNIYLGRLDKAQSAVDRLNDIIDVYDNDFTLLAKYRLNANLLIERRALDQALAETETAIEFVQKKGLLVSLINLYACQARIHMLQGDVEAAETSLTHADEIRSRFNAAPIQLCCYYGARLENDLYRMKQAMDGGDTTQTAVYREKAGQSARMMQKFSRKASQHRTDAYKLTGSYYWLNRNDPKALRWWRKAIEEGRRLGARLELSRTYFEVGKCLSAPGRRPKTLDGADAGDFMKKAGRMFEDMALRWDLAQWRTAMQAAGEKPPATPAEAAAQMPEIS